MSQPSHIIGAHVSASGGIDKAIQRAHNIGCNALQLFSGSPRVWKKLALDKHPIDDFLSEQAKYKVQPVFTHALYLVNLASEKPELVEKSLNSLIYELQFDSLIHGSGVIVHLGSHQGRGWDAVKKDVAERIQHILKETPDDSTFLIENSAGQKGKLCSDLSEIRWLLDQVKSKRLGWCVDTCHAHAAGYRLSLPSFLSAKDLAEVEEGSLSADEAETSSPLSADPRGGEENGESPLTPPRGNLIGTITDLNLWDSLKCVHVNDSRDDFGSGRDRHDNLGDGKISAQDLQSFLTNPKIITKPLILEVPGLNKQGPDKENVERLKRMVE